MCVLPMHAITCSNGPALPGMRPPPPRCQLRAAPAPGTGCLDVLPPNSHSAPRPHPASTRSAACKWLGNFLRNGIPPSTSVVLVSHDEALLESACDRIVEVGGGGAWVQGVG